MHPHLGNNQPANTIGKVVTYKNRDVLGERGEIIAAGRWHAPMHADYMNWKTNGEKCATIGAIDLYKIIN